MILHNKTSVILLAISLLVMASCSPPAPDDAGVPVTGDTPVANTPAASPDLPAQAVLDAQQWLATRLSIAVEEVQLIEAQQAEWTDSCLGLGRPNESCLQAITPGWQVVFEVNGQRYEIRTDRSASTIRIAAPEDIPGTETGLENTSWNLVSFGPAGAEEPLVEGSTISLLLGGGQAGGSGGCNAYGGSYQVQGSTISFDQITSTLLACQDERITEQEQRYFAALGSAGEYRVEGDRLLIMYGDGDGVLTFEPGLLAPPATPTTGS